MPSPPTVDDAWLHALQKSTFRYFWEQANPKNGLIADNTLAATPASIAALNLHLHFHALILDGVFAPVIPSPRPARAPAPEVCLRYGCAGTSAF